MNIDYDYIGPGDQITTGEKRGKQCGRCDKKFDYGVIHNFICPDDLCPLGWQQRRSSQSIVISSKELK